MCLKLNKGQKHKQDVDPIKNKKFKLKKKVHLHVSQMSTCPTSWVPKQTVKHTFHLCVIIIKVSQT